MEKWLILGLKHLVVPGSKEMLRKKDEEEEERRKRRKKKGILKDIGTNLKEIPPSGQSWNNLNKQTMSVLGCNMY